MQSQHSPQQNSPSLHNVDQNIFTAGLVKRKKREMRTLHRKK